MGNKLLAGVLNDLADLPETIDGGVMEKRVAPNCQPAVGLACCLDTLFEVLPLYAGKRLQVSSIGQERSIRVYGHNGSV
jgi:hypothetical protein